MNINTTLHFQNTELPLEERVIDLVSRFTLEEKIKPNVPVSDGNSPPWCKAI